MTKDKKIGVVVAFRDFKDEEFFKPNKVLEEAGVEVVVISDKKGIAIGESGGEVKVDRVLKQASAADLEGVLFIGGPGALKHLDGEESYRLAEKAEKEEKIVGAICISPLILAKAGLLKGKKATVWSSALNKKPIRTLEKEGARFEEEPVVRDGKVITACGPKAAEAFGKKVLDALN